MAIKLDVCGSSPKGQWQILELNEFELRFQILDDGGRDTHLGFCQHVLNALGLPIHKMAVIVESIPNQTNYLGQRAQVHHFGNFRICLIL